MIGFTTLFLFLVTGIHPVGVVVSEDVVSVEFVLDGHQIGIVRGEPWKIECDFGVNPLPHELIAIARGESDREIASVRQLINVPRSRSELHLALSRSPGKAPSAVRVIIGNPIFVEPEHIIVKFDGSQLKFEDPDFIPLPDYDEASTHVISAEVEFTDQSVAHSAISFSPWEGGESGKRLTAISIEIESDHEPTIASLENVFHVNGRRVGVSAVERSGGRVVMVRDREATQELMLLGSFRDRQLSRGKLQELRRGIRVEDDSQLKQLLFRVVEAIPVQRETEAGKLEKSFWVSPQYRVEDSGLDWVSTHIFPRPAERIGDYEWQQVADAVAMAGLQAAASGRPRVVLLAVGDKNADRSFFAEEPVKNFLRALSVPLVVWATDREAAKRWRTDSIIKGPKQIVTAAQDAERLLSKQWIVWLDGLHLPSDVTLHSPPEGIRIAAR